MTEQIVLCPQCQGQVCFSGPRRFVQCACCGSNLAIRRDEAGQASLEMPGPAFLELAATSPGERAKSLALQVSDAQEELQLRQAEVDATSTAYWRGRLGLQRVIAGSQNCTYVSGLLCAAAGFLALFALQSDERLYGGAIALLIALVAWAFQREWRSEEKLGEADLAGSLAAVAEARAAYDATMNRLADLSCEQSICVAFASGATEAAPA